MASLVRSFRTAFTLPAMARPQSQAQQVRAFGFSAIRKAGGGGTPQLFGEGAKAGEVPTE